MIEALLNDPNSFTRRFILATTCMLVARNIRSRKFSNPLESDTNYSNHQLAFSTLIIETTTRIIFRDGVAVSWLLPNGKSWPAVGGFGYAAFKLKRGNDDDLTTAGRQNHYQHNGNLVELWQTPQQYSHFGREPNQVSFWQRYEYRMRTMRANQ